jgi:hypothetical protein
VLKQDRTNANAWWLLANLLEDDERKLKALDRVLALEPTHKGANAMKNKLVPKTPPFTNDGEFSESVDLSTPDGRMKPKNMVKSKYREEEEQETVVPTSIRIAFGLLAVFIIGLVVVFGVIPMLQGGGPVAAAEEYFQALSNQDYDRLRELTCARDVSQVDLLEQQFTSLEPLVPEGQSISFETSGLEVRLIEQRDEEAFVNIGGTLTISAGDAMQMDFNIDELIAMAGLPEAEANGRLILEDGVWKICDS